MANEARKQDYDAKELGNDIAKLIYDQGKAQIFNVLESQFENDKDNRLVAMRRLATNILDDIGENASRFIEHKLGDWKVVQSYELTDSEQERLANKTACNKA